MIQEDSHSSQTACLQLGGTRSVITSDYQAIISLCLCKMDTYKYFFAFSFGLCTALHANE